MPRRLTLNSQSYRGTVNSNWAVHPKTKGKGVGGKLFRAYLDLPRDLALNDEVMDAAHAVEDQIGVATSPFHSIRWVLPLRPVARMEQLVGSRLPPVAGWVTRPSAKLVDSVMRTVPRSPFRIPRPDLHESPIDAGQLGDLIREFGSLTDLRPVTNDGSTEWLVRRARAMTQHGELRMMKLCEKNGELAGWYVYNAKPGGQGEVLQLVATKQSAQAERPKGRGPYRERRVEPRRDQHQRTAASRSAVGAGREAGGVRAGNSLDADQLEQARAARGVLARTAAAIAPRRRVVPPRLASATSRGSCFTS